MKFIKANRIHLIVLLYFIVAVVYATYPLITRLNSGIFGLGDEILQVWILQWDIHAFLTNPLTIFQANIFYPYSNTLAYSDSLFTSAALGSFALLFTKEPLAVFNVSFLLSMIMLGYSIYLLVFYLTKDKYAGIVSGTILTFCTYTITRMNVLQLISIQWVVFSALFFLMYIQRKKFVYLLVASVFFVLQAANSLQPAYFLGFSLLFFAVLTAVKKRKVLELFLQKRVLFLGLLTLLITICIGLPYFLVSQEFHYKRDIRDTIHIASRPEYILYPSQKTKLYGVLMETFYTNDTGPYVYEGYIGFTFILLLGILIIWKYILRKKITSVYFTPFFILGVSSLILSLGPVWQWGGKVVKIPFMIPLPYVVFYYLVPGFNGFRNSARWEFYGLVWLAVAIGIAYASYTKKYATSKKYLLLSVLCILTLAEIQIPIHYESPPLLATFPRVYEYIRQLPQDGAMIELPWYTWNMPPYSNQEFMREYYSVTHFRNMVNGYSGFSPLIWEAQARQTMLAFPEQGTLGILRKQGVRYLILHKEEYLQLEEKGFLLDTKPVRTWNSVKKSLDARNDVKLINQIGDDYIYKII